MGLLEELFTNPHDRTEERVRQSLAHLRHQFPSEGG